jgi:hypothetical protein
MLNSRRQLKRRGTFPIYPIAFLVFCLKIIFDKSFFIDRFFSFDLVYFEK